jgi:hypothetical protein
MRTKFFTLIVTICLIWFSAITHAETLVSKDDADKVFAMTKPEWEKAALSFNMQGWEAKAAHFPTGTVVQALNRANGYGLLIEPVFKDDNSKPEVLKVSSLYPRGTMQELFADVKDKVEAEAQSDLGAAYTVLAQFILPNDNSEGVELTIKLKRDQ